MFNSKKPVKPQGTCRRLSESSIADLKNLMSATWGGNNNFSIDNQRRGLKRPACLDRNTDHTPKRRNIRWARITHLYAEGQIPMQTILHCHLPINIGYLFHEIYRILKITRVVMILHGFSLTNIDNSFFIFLHVGRRDVTTHLLTIDQSGAHIL